MESGGDLLLGDAVLLDSIHILSSGIDGRQQLRRIQTPERLLRHLQQLPDERGPGLHPLVPLGRRGAQADSGEGRLDDVGRLEMSPMLARELVER